LKAREYEGKVEKEKNEEAEAQEKENEGSLQVNLGIMCSS